MMPAVPRHAAAHRQGQPRAARADHRHPRGARVRARARRGRALRRRQRRADRQRAARRLAAGADVPDGDAGVQRVERRGDVVRRRTASAAGELQIGELDRVPRAT